MGQHRKMKVLLACLLSVGVCSAFELKHEPVTRVLRADSLRDFKGMCFASTQCKVYKKGEAWQLKPFCGVSNCVGLDDGTLGEQITDCGKALQACRGCVRQEGRLPRLLPCVRVRRGHRAR